MEYQQLLPTLISPPILKFGSSLTFLKAYLMGMFRKPSSTAMAYYVDEAKVQEAKKICTTGFISTNDILTSHYTSSWAIKGTDRPFDLGFAEQQLHLPVLFLGVPIAKFPMDMALVFRPAPKKLAVLYIVKQFTPVKLLSSGASILGESLNKNMFPVSDKENQVKVSKKVTPL